MRLDRVALKGFQSHADTDWSPGDARLVALVGENGAGKSSLLDAIAYALYDGARVRTDGLVRLGATHMSVLVEFTLGGARYRVTRGYTSRAGGKSTLELAIHDEAAWRPLTGDTIADTQRAIVELLRLDSATFSAAVLLGQGEASLFAKSKPAERKRILGVVLGLDRYEAAEKVARSRARDLEAEVDQLTATLRRLEGERSELDGPADQYPVLEAELAALGESEALGHRLRDEAEARLRTLAGQLAEAKAAEADVARLAAVVLEHKASWQGVDDRRRTWQQRITAATQDLLAADQVSAAIAALPAARDLVAELEVLEQHHADATSAYGEALELYRLAEQGHQNVVLEHRHQVALLEDRVALLEAQIVALSPVTCPDCGATFPADPAGLAEQLRTTRAEVDAWPSAPEEPLRVQRHRAAVSRARTKVSESGHDPATLADARRVLGQLEQLAARAGEMASHQARLEEAREGLALAATEIKVIERTGTETRQALEAATAIASGGDGIKAQEREATEQQRVAREGLAKLASRRDWLTGQSARAQAARDRLAIVDNGIKATEAERDTAQDRALRTRQLVAAFGVKGIPARIIDSVLPELTDSISESLAQMFPEMSMAIRTQRATKDGDGVIEELDLIVITPAGERVIATYSGGERTAIDLGIALGLARLVSRRAGSAVRLLCVDEPDGLDTGHRRALGQLLKRLSHQGELERIVLVTHNPDLAEYGESVYAVSRDGHGSHIELAA